VTALPLHPINMFHVGIVVPDIGQAIQDMKGIGVLNWMEVGQADSIRRANGLCEPISLLWSFSAEPGAHIELIEPLIAPATTSLGVHHVGYWSTDIMRDTELLAAASYESEFDLGYSADDDAHIRFFISAAGPRIELVSDSLRAGLELAWTSACPAYATS
jgi:hypothetical protein